jgi:rhodanese-related sulfurtransferase
MASVISHPNPATHFIAPLDLATLQSGGKAKDLIDVRTPVEYAAVHATGATLIPLNRIDPSEVLAHRLDDPDQPIYLICKSGSRSNKARERFAQAGFPNAVSVEGGTDAWQAAGLPVIRNRKILPLERQALIGAGIFVLTGVTLGYLVHPLLFALCAIPGCGLILSGTTNICLMAILLAKMPWNRRLVCDRR